MCKRERKAKRSRTARLESEKKRMSQQSFKDGERAGRDGREASPPEFGFFGGPIGEMCFGVTEKMVKDSAHDYMNGYGAGSQQRLADAMEDDD